MLAEQHNATRRDRRKDWHKRNRFHPEHRRSLIDNPSGNIKMLGPSGAWRRDPRSQYFMGVNGLRRVDRSNYSAGVMAVPVAKVSSKIERPLHRVDDANQFIFVVADLAGGRLSDHDRDLLGLGQCMAEQLSGDGIRCAVTLVVFGDHRETDLALVGVDRIIQFAGGEYEGFNPEQRLRALQTLEQDWHPTNWLFPDSTYGGRDLGLRLAAAEGIAANTGVWQVTAENIICRGGADLVDITTSPSRIILALEECAMPVTRTRHEAIALPRPCVSESNSQFIEDCGNLAMDPNQIALAEAEFVLSGGNGVRDWELFHRASAALGATEGASRVAVDDGYMERARQVGATGTWVTARVYLAVGISGAVQHLQGIARCDKVIAINVDKNCDMIKRADLSVIGDSSEIMQSLIDLVEAHRSRGSQDDDSDPSQQSQEANRGVI